MVNWETFKNSFYYNSYHEFSLDFSRASLSEQFISQISPAVDKAFSQMAALEKGAIANPDEGRMVGHYWLRNAKGAPTAELTKEIEVTLADLKDFAKKIHNGQIAPRAGTTFKHLLVIGIGGSALGPQFLSHALSSTKDPLDLYFFDNTDPDGMQRVLDKIPTLARTVVVVISKSGGTKETRNGQVIAKAAFAAQKLSISNHFVAVTGDGSELYKTAVAEKWLKTFPMWDWVGGRTSELSAVGLVPASLQGFDVDSLLAGAFKMDQLTAIANWRQNPAMVLALCWYRIGNGKGEKDMVILPYKDRLELFSRYLQQLVMESLGKEKDLSGHVVNQGIAVYGNKGSTDQHAYVQQLREGVANFFAVFIQVLKAEAPRPDGTTSLAAGFQVEPGVTAAQYLSGFYQGTREALYEKGRESISITIDTVNAETIGMLIALFERAVGFYAYLININAYHQPGVEAGKKAAAAVLTLQQNILGGLSDEPQTVEEIAIKLAVTPEQVFHIVRSLSANHTIKEVRADAASILNARYTR